MYFKKKSTDVSRLVTRICRCVVLLSNYVTHTSGNVHVLEFCRSKGSRSRFSGRHVRACVRRARGGRPSRSPEEHTYFTRNVHYREKNTYPADVDVDHPLLPPPRTNYSPPTVSVIGHVLIICQPLVSPRSRDCISVRFMKQWRLGATRCVRVPTVEGSY